MTEWPHGDTPPHPATEASNALKTASKYDPERVRSVLVERALNDYADSLVEAVKLRDWCPQCRQPSRPRVSALRLFSTIAKLTGNALGDRISELLIQLGVQNLRELQSAVDVYRTGASTSLEEAREEGVAILRMVLIEHPEWADDVLSRLEATRRRKLDRSRAVIVEPETNGGGS